MSFKSNGRYYCVKGYGSDSRDNYIHKPYRVVFYKDSFPFIPSGLVGHNTIKELRKNDSTWKEYYANDPKSALKICKPRFICKPEKFVIMPLDKNFEDVAYKLLKHTVMGEEQNGLTGIHLKSNFNPNIKHINETKPPDLNGVWVADIVYFSPTKNKILTKHNSTMFPQTWDPTTFMFKMYFAYNTKRQCRIDASIFHSNTDCGIRVDFVIKNNNLKSVYPIYLGAESH